MIKDMKKTNSLNSIIIKLPYLIKTINDLRILNTLKSLKNCTKI